jgi:hypothetical protein
VTDLPREVIHALRGGDPGAVEPALAYLEADPWEMFSGYAKASLMRALPRYELDLAQRHRVDSIILRHVDVGNRLEFGDSCRFARRCGTRLLRDPLVDRLHGSDTELSMRALRVLLSIRRPRLEDRDLAVARELVTTWMGMRHHRFTRWLVEAGPRLWTAEWAARLERDAATLPLGDRSDGSRRTLELVRPRGAPPAGP